MVSHKSIAVEKIPLFLGLTPDELSRVKHCLRERSFSKGQIILSEGDNCSSVFIVQSGRIKLFRMSSQGREQILEMLEPGDTCACNPGASEWQCMVTAQAAVPSKVWFLSREHYVNLVQTNAKLSNALNRVFAQRLRCFSSLIEEVSLKDTKKRLVKFLLDMLDQQDKNTKQEMLFIPFTREELAQRIGAVRETVARQLAQLKKAKLIDLKPHAIVIRNVEGLRKLLA